MATQTITNQEQTEHTDTHKERMVATLRQLRNLTDYERGSTSIYEEFPKDDLRQIEAVIDLLNSYPSRWREALINHLALTMVCNYHSRE